MVADQSGYARAGAASPKCSDCGAPIALDDLLAAESRSLSDLRQAVIAIVREHGLQHREVPFRLASGELSHDYLDGKKALSAGRHLATACQAIVELARERGAAFDAVGGLTLGADSFAHLIAYLTATQWFVVRKQAKDHGTTRRVEGAVLNSSSRVLLVDDVVTTGGSILEALDEVQRTGAQVALAVALVDRGDEAQQRFAERGVSYAPLISYKDLGIAAVGRRKAAAPD